MSKRPAASSSGGGTASKVAKSESEGATAAKKPSGSSSSARRGRGAGGILGGAAAAAVAERRAQFAALDKDKLLEKCLSLSTQVIGLNEGLKHVKRREYLARLRGTLKDKELFALTKERDASKWKLLGETQPTRLRKGALMDVSVHEAFYAMRDELRTARADLDSAKCELKLLRGKGTEEGAKEFEKVKKLNEENEKLRSELMKRSPIEKELALCQRACQAYRQQIKDLEKEVNERNSRIRALEEQPKTTETAVVRKEEAQDTKKDADDAEADKGGVQVATTTTNETTVEEVEEALEEEVSTEAIETDTTANAE